MKDTQFVVVLLLENVPDDIYPNFGVNISKLFSYNENSNSYPNAVAFTVKQGRNSQIVSF